MPNQVRAPRAASYAMLALAQVLLLAACGGNADNGASSPASPASRAASGEPVADPVHIDAAVGENPCELAPAEMVAGLFGVPVTDLEREPSVSSACAYGWESNDGTERLDVKVKVSDIGEDAGRTASNFRAVTRGMSGAEVDRAMARVKEDAASGGSLGTAGKRGAADAVVGATSGSAGIRFEDVAGVGDEARFALTVGAGDLHVRTGNLYFTVSAYSGPAMEMPERLTGASIMAADRQWRQDTMPQRREAAVALAQAVVQSLAGRGVQ